MSMHGIAALYLVVAVLCTYRLTRLVVTDTIWGNSRDRLLVWLANVPERIRPGSRRRLLVMLISGKAEELIGCPFCAGFWVATAVHVTWCLAARVTGIPLAEHVLVIFAIAGGQSLLTAWE